MKPSYEELEARCAALAAEVQSVKDGAAKAIDDIQCFHNTDGWHVSEDGESETAVVSLDDAKGSVEHFVLKVETPSTDAFLAEVRAQGRNEGINFAASRLAAAFNNGFVDKQLAEVADVVQMILDAKADMANNPNPPADGLSGEYARKSLEDWKEQLRGEASS